MSPLRKVLDPNEQWLCPQCCQLAMDFRQAFERYLVALGDLNQAESRGIALNHHQRHLPTRARKEAEKLDLEFRAHVSKTHPNTR